MRLGRESSGYDASGRLAYYAKRQSGLGTIEMRITFDPMGRALEASTTRAVVEGADAMIEMKTIYDLPDRTIIRIDPTSGATVPAEEVRSHHLTGIYDE